MHGMAVAREPRSHAWRFLPGAVLAAGALLALAEAFLRLSPPRDLLPYLGDDSPLTGIYAPDEDFGFTYRNWEAFRADNAGRLTPYLPFHGHADSRKVWAFFGNSFVQAPGMLADCARGGVPDRQIFNLGKNELLPLRFAQVKLLLENGLEPERLFFELMPVDTALLGKQPLDLTRINARGAVTYRVRRPAGPVGWLLDSSRLALTAWVRSGRQGNTRFNAKTLYQRIDPWLLADLRRLFAGLARQAREHNVPVTVLLIPASPCDPRSAARLPGHAGADVARPGLRRVRPARRLLRPGERGGPVPAGQALQRRRQSPAAGGIAPPCPLHLGQSGAVPY